MISVNTLRVFEVAARHLSFTGAAKELKVRQPAVSRQVAMLEKQLGQALFIRRKPRLELTTQGQMLFSAVSSGFEQINKAVDAIRSMQGQSQLIVNVSIGIASCWLMSRLADFRQRYPNIDLQLITRDSNRGYDEQTSDIVVMFGAGNLPGYHSRLLFRETLFPICSVDYLSGKLSTQELSQSRLLYLRDGDHESDWHRLFHGHHVKLPVPEAESFYNSYIVYLQAALNGDGIALGWQFLMSDLIEAGRLRVASDIFVTTNRGYHCCFFERARNKPQANLFVEWLVDQADHTPAVIEDSMKARTR